MQKNHTKQLTNREALILEALAGVFNRPADVVEGLYCLTRSLDKTVIILELAEIKGVMDMQIARVADKWERERAEQAGKDRV